MRLRVHFGAFRSLRQLEVAVDQPDATNVGVCGRSGGARPVRSADLAEDVECLHLPEDVERDQRRHELVFAGVEQQEPINRHLFRSMPAPATHHGVQSDMVAGRGG